MLPKPGEGPAKAVRDGGCFHAHAVGTVPAGDDAAAAPRRRVYAHVGMEGADPGYKGTALMAAARRPTTTRAAPEPCTALHCRAAPPGRWRSNRSCME